MPVKTTHLTFSWGSPVKADAGCERVCGIRTDIYVDDPTIKKKKKTTMDLRKDKKHVYGAGEGDSSTGAVAGSQVGPTASSFHDHGHSGIDRQAPGCVYASGEDITQRMEVVEKVREPPRKATRGARKTSERSESLFLAPAMVADVTSPMAGLLRV